MGSNMIIDSNMAIDSNMVIGSNMAVDSRLDSEHIVVLQVLDALPEGGPLLSEIAKSPNENARVPVTRHPIPEGRPRASGREP